jgi:hypothetical protein
MSKAYLYLSQVLFVGSVLFSFQASSKESLKFYKDSKQVSPKDFLTNRESLNSEEILQQCEKNVLAVVDDKIYLNPDKLLIYQGHCLLQNDQQQWIRVEQIFKDEMGFYTAARPECDKGHPGFKKVWNTWYCLKQGCPYYCFDHDECLYR